MGPYLLDTNHAGMLLRPDGTKLWRRLAALPREACALCRPVVAELWFMVFNSQKPEANTRRLDALLSQFDILEFDERAGVEFGRIRAELRRKGTPVPAFDVLIAAIARIHRRTVASGDTHFSHIDGLTVESWL